MKLFIILTLASYAFSATISDHQLGVEWENFKKENDRKYLGAEEEAFRKDLFAKTLKFVQEHNARYDQGLEQFTLGITSLADFTDEEKERVISCSRPTDMSMLSNENVRDFSHINITDIPKAIDWRALGFMSKVKNQNKCGSCWSFSAIGSTEARLNIKSKTSKLPTLSEQQILDCAPTGDCNGGFAREALKYLALNGGINSDSNYKICS
ncbi:cathepsin L2-like [Tribolium madens]|uniref:cathepsin L2-like n=1 Tax=Tribolium madens TaxID=41895 RepID=UPI001CF73C58|nr:cathepsin L2-like [Tribolium madens]